ncbi:hypothetical protein [Cellulomonas phragmiteti]|nr:hypothetical protein [Cellulomonas phragmiteti]
MTSMPLTLEVNGALNSPETIDPMPSTQPYTPNHSTGVYKRYNTDDPQSGQFGTTNTVLYVLDSGAGGKVGVTVDVSFTAYSANQDLLFFLFKEACVATCLSDNNAYLGHSGDTIVMSPTGSGLRL